MLSLSLRRIGVAAAAAGREPLVTGARGFARKRAASPDAETAKAATTTDVVPQAEGPPPAAVAESYGPWKPVVDKDTQLVYYWNTETNETTALGHLPPGVVAPNAHQAMPPGQYQQPTLGRTLAEGVSLN
mmetsp:Transcript_7634/g.13999  ORF Transcript_7634/g.13999 Transcript_7634/m.13999 type:complete len:130 (-) Transcript_7634:512-901(-)